MINSKERFTENDNDWQLGRTLRLMFADCKEASLTAGDLKADGLMKTAKCLELASDPTEVGKFEGENFLKVALCFVLQDDRENCL